jgi:hypothetical protein
VDGSDGQVIVNLCPGVGRRRARLPASQAIQRVLAVLTGCVVLGAALAGTARGQQPPFRLPSASFADTVVCGGDGEMRIAELQVRHRAPSLVADLAIAHLLSDAFAAQLRDGVPATIFIDIELWRSRNAWFDRFEVSRSLIFRLQYDIWEQAYAISAFADGDKLEQIYASLDEARTLLCRQEGIALVDLAALEPGKDYYLVATAALKPMTLEDVTELESWLSGELTQRRGRGFGILGLPKQLFGVILNLTGLRDQNASVRTSTFTLGAARDGTSLELR